jgi:Kef-type K+ transport system membrane component KefB
VTTTVLLLQLIVILVTARACGWLLKHIGQPSVSTRPTGHQPTAAR